MTRVTTSALNLANNGNIKTSIQAVLDKIDSVTSAIDNFSSQSETVLIGQGYNSVRRILSFYRDAFVKMKQALINFDDSMTSNNNSMINFMDEFSDLDTAREPEIKSLIDRLERQIAAVEATSAESLAKIGIDKYALLAYLREILAYFKKLYKKLVDLPPTDRTLFDGLQSAYQNIQILSSSAESIVIQNYWYNAHIDGLKKGNIDEERELPLLIEAIENWPADIDPRVVQMVSLGLSCIGTGITYTNDTGPRNAIDPETGLPSSADCSSFTRYLFNNAFGLDLPEYTNTYQLNSLHQEIYPETGEPWKSGTAHTNEFYDYPFVEVPNEEIQPGDYYVDAGSHVRVCVGLTDDNQPVYIEVHDPSKNNNSPARTVQVVTDGNVHTAQMNPYYCHTMRYEGLANQNITEEDSEKDK